MRRDNDTKARIILALAVLVIVVAGVLVVLINLYIYDWWRYLLIVPVVISAMGYLAMDITALLRYYRQEEGEKEDLETDVPTALTLVSEEQSDVQYWDLEGKTSLVIGRSTDDEDVEVDLTGTEYFSFISDVHAVLNLTNKGWFLEDAHSKNGTSIRRSGTERPLVLEPGEPVPLKSGDTIYLAGDTKLIVQ